MSEKSGCFWCLHARALLQTGPSNKMLLVCVAKVPPAEALYGGRIIEEKLEGCPNADCHPFGEEVQALVETMEAGCSERWTVATQHGAI